MLKPLIWASGVGLNVDFSEVSECGVIDQGIPNKAAYPSGSLVALGLS